MAETSKSRIGPGISARPQQTIAARLRNTITARFSLPETRWNGPEQEIAVSVRGVRSAPEVVRIPVDYPPMPAPNIPSMCGGIIILGPVVVFLVLVAACLVLLAIAFRKRPASRTESLLHSEAEPPPSRFRTRRVLPWVLTLGCVGNLVNVATPMFAAWAVRGLAVIVCALAAMTLFVGRTRGANTGVHGRLPDLPKS